MPIQYFGEAHNPVTDNANSPSGPTVALIPPSSMEVGDFVLVSLVYRGQVTWTNSVTGGQTWSSSANQQSGTINTARLFWCVFNGTWDADPVFTVTTGTLGAQGWMAVWRGVNTPTPWDVTPVIAAQTASTTFVISTFNTNSPSALALVGASSSDNNTWSVDNSFTHPSGSGVVDWTSSAGTDNSLVMASREFATAGAVGATTMTQDTLGGDLGTKWYGALRATPQSYAQVQAQIKSTSSAYAQAEGSIFYQYAQTAQAQAQVILEALSYKAFAQGSTHIKTTDNYQVASVQTQILTDYRVVAQTQVQIRVIYAVFAQSSVWIKSTDRPQFAQTQAHIRERLEKFAQAQTQIKTITNNWAQSQAYIVGIAQGYAQAQSTILSALVVYNNCAQSQAAISVDTDIYQYIDESIAVDSDYILTALNATYIGTLEDINEPEYRQDHIIRYRAYKQGFNANLTVNLLRAGVLVASRTVALTDTPTTYQYALTTNEIDSITDYAFLQQQFGAALDSDTKAYVTWTEVQLPSGVAKIRRPFAQVQAFIQLGTVQRVFAQVQAAIKITNTQSAQATAYIKITQFAYGQAQTQILIPSYGMVAQAGAHITTIGLVYGQATTWIAGAFLRHAQAQAKIRGSVQQYAQALADIKAISNGHSQALADIKRLYVASGQARAYVESAYAAYANARATIKAVAYASGQAQAQIKVRTSQYAQASVAVKTTGIVCAQASAKIVYTGQSKYAQVQASIKVTGNAIFAQVQAQLKNAYQAYANAQALVGTNVNKSAQAQASIITTYSKGAQVNATINNAYQAVAQVSVWIKTEQIQWAQVQAVILKLAGYAQAQAHIRIENYIKSITLSDSIRMTMTLADRIVLSITLDDIGLTMTLGDSGITLDLLDNDTITLELDDINY